MIRLVRDGRTLCTGAETVEDRETYVSRPGVERLPAIRAALDAHMPARQAGPAVDSMCRHVSGRHMAWRHREDEPMLRDAVSLHWAPGATRQWREEEKWLPQGSTTLVLEIMTDAAAALDMPLAA